MGNMMCRDDAVGSILATRLQGKVPFRVFDAGPSPENYLGKIIREKPDNVIVIDAVDFGGEPGDCRVLEGNDIKTENLFSTHNASISLTTNYLQNNLTTDIIILAIQPKSVAFGEDLSPEVSKALITLEEWFCAAVKTQG
jgi:hydrogenase 3 maturation protease